MTITLSKPPWQIWTISAIMGLLAICFFVMYLHGRYIVANTNPIKYKYISITKSTGRGTSYRLLVAHGSKQYSVEITSRISNEITQKKFPPLYYSKVADRVISEWTVIVCLRIVYVFMGIGMGLIILSLFTNPNSSGQSVIESLF